MKDQVKIQERQSLFSLKMLRNYCNENFVKKTQNKFTSQDIQQYIIRGRLPEYLGNHVIESVEQQGVKMYKLISK